VTNAHTEAAFAAIILEGAPASDRHRSTRSLNFACKPLISDAANLARFEKFTQHFKGFTCLLISGS
jgi:hypothetical protein